MAWRSTWKTTSSRCERERRSHVYDQALLLVLGHRAHDLVPREAGLSGEVVHQGHGKGRVDGARRELIMQGCLEQLCWLSQSWFHLS